MAIAEVKEKNVNFLKEVTKNPYILAVTIFVSLSGFTFGYDQGFISGVLVMESFGAKFPRIYADSEFQGWFVASFLFTAWLGSLIVGPVVEKLGRKRTIMVLCAEFIVGSAFQTAAYNLPMLFFGRAFAGLAIGSLCVVGPLYTTECSSPSIRGGLVNLQQFMITVGILITYWIDYGCNLMGGNGGRCDPNTPYTGGTPDAREFDPYNDAPNGCPGQPDAAWRIPIGLQMLSAFALAIGMIFLPDTPRWLMQQGRDKQAMEVISKFRRLDPTDPAVVNEYAEIKGEILFEKDLVEQKFSGKRGIKLLTARYVDILTTRSSLKRVFIAASLMWLQQFVGINALIYYAPTFFAKLGMSSNTTSLLATGVYGIINTLSTIPAILFVDRFGRRKLLMCGGVGMLVAMVVEAGVVGMYGDDMANHKSAGTAGIVFVYVYCVNFAYSFGPIAWSYQHEILPLGIRSLGVSISTSSAWMSNAIIALVTPLMMENIKWGTYVFFAGFILAGLVFVWFCVPETRLKTLEEMDEVFGDNQAFEDKQRLAAATAKASGVAPLHHDTDEKEPQHVEIEQV